VREGTHKKVVVVLTKLWVDDINEGRFTLN